MARQIPWTAIVCTLFLLGWAENSFAQRVGKIRLRPIVVEGEPAVPTDLTTTVPERIERFRVQAAFARYSLSQIGLEVEVESPVMLKRPYRPKGWREVMDENVDPITDSEIQPIMLQHRPAEIRVIPVFLFGHLKAESRGREGFIHGTTPTLRPSPIGLALNCANEKMHTKSRAKYGDGTLAHECLHLLAYQAPINAGKDRLHSTNVADLIVAGPLKHHILRLSSFRMAAPIGRVGLIRNVDVIGANEGFIDRIYRSPFVEERFDGNATAHFNIQHGYHFLLDDLPDNFEAIYGIEKLGLLVPTIRLSIEGAAKKPFSIGVHQFRRKGAETKAVRQGQNVELSGAMRYESAAWETAESAGFEALLEPERKQGRKGSLEKPAQGAKIKIAAEWQDLEPFRKPRFGLFRPLNLGARAVLVIQMSASLASSPLAEVKSKYPPDFVLTLEGNIWPLPEILAHSDTFFGVVGKIEGLEGVEASFVALSHNRQQLKIKMPDDWLNSVVSRPITLRIPIDAAAGLESVPGLGGEHHPTMSSLGGDTPSIEGMTESPSSIAAQLRSLSTSELKDVSNALVETTTQEARDEGRMLNSQEIARVREIINATANELARRGASE